MLESAFERYTKRHYKSWVAFARQKDYGDDVQPVLVSGFDMTRDFAMVAYSYEDTPIKPGMTIPAPTRFVSSPSFGVTWLARYTPYTNYGPQESILPLPGKGMDTSSLQSAQSGEIPSEFNQCVFIRYYTSSQ